MTFSRAGSCCRAINAGAGQAVNNRIGMWSRVCGRVVFDGRGVRVSIWDGLVKSSRADGSSDEKTYARRIALQAWPAGFGLAFVSALLIGFVVAATCWVKLCDWVGPRCSFTTDAWIMIVVLACAAIPAVACILVFARVAARRMVRLQLENQRCPSCNYPLGPVRKESDECSVCSECGAAWKMPAPESGKP